MCPTSGVVPQSSWRWTAPGTGARRPLAGASLSFSVVWLVTHLVRAAGVVRRSLLSLQLHGPCLRCAATGFGPV
eukprot:3760491-Pyramimonas_sp.AAC.1